MIKPRIATPATWYRIGLRWPSAIGIVQIHRGAEVTLTLGWITNSSEDGDGMDGIHHNLHKAAFLTKAFCCLCAVFFVCVCKLCWMVMNYHPLTWRNIIHHSSWLRVAKFSHGLERDIILKGTGNIITDRISGWFIFWIHCSEFPGLSRLSRFTFILV